MNEPQEARLWVVLLLALLSGGLGLLIWRKRTSSYWLGGKTTQDAVNTAYMCWFVSAVCFVVIILRIFRS